MSVEDNIYSPDFMKKVDDISKYAPDLLNIYLLCEVKKSEPRRPSMFSRIIKKIINPWG